MLGLRREFNLRSTTTTSLGLALFACNKFLGLDRHVSSSVSGLQLPIYPRPHRCCFIYVFIFPSIFFPFKFEDRVLYIIYYLLGSWQQLGCCVLLCCVCMCEWKYENDHPTACLILAFLWQVWLHVQSLQPESIYCT